MNRLLIIAHGQPSDPLPAARALEDLAGRVAAHLPEWQVGAATLAEAGRLEAEAAGVPGWLFPLFMAGGWFTRVHIPDRLTKAGASGWQMLEPFGCLTALHDLTVEIARESAAPRLILAGHGSFKSPVPAAIVGHVAGRITREAGIATSVAFIDQTPRLDQLEAADRAATCLPFFAMAGGHVADDIPAGLDRAGFAGTILPPVGLDARVPALIAAAARARQGVCAGACRYAPGAVAASV